MATADAGLFGPSPWEIQQAQQQALQTAAGNYANQTPLQRAAQGMFTAGGQLGGMGAQAMGGVNVAQQQAAQNQQALQGADLQSPEGLRAAAKKMLDVGNQRGAYLLAQKAAEIEKQEQATTLAARKQDFQENEAMQLKRDQLSQAVELKKMQLEQAAEAARLRSEDARYSADQRAAAAREATAARLQLGQLMAEIKRMGLETKGDTTRTKAEEKAAKAQEGKEGLEGDITQARTIIADLDKSGGITSTQRGSLANTLTSLSTSGVGQAFGRVVGSEDQSKRDQLKSLRLQLLNSIKQVTGMGSAQLNSNVELKTWLESLGSDGMSKEANEAILQNIENKYLKGATKPPTTTPATKAPIYATNGKDRIVSTDGGITWKPAGAK